MLATLQELKDSQKLCELYIKTDTNLFLQGYLLAFDDDHVLIASITEDGISDGFLLFELENIRRIEHSSIYEERNEFLYKARHQYHAQLNLQPNIPLFKQILEMSKRNQRIIRVFLTEDDDNSVNGYVQDYNEDRIILKVFDDCGEENGSSVVDLYMIFIIEFDSSVCDSIELLRRNPLC